MIETKINYSHYYKFKAKFIVIPTSFNRLGVDALPRFFIKPTELMEIMEYSKTPRSIDDDFKKDEESGLYLKNKTETNSKINYEEINSQFLAISISPPYWFYDETTYASFCQINMSSSEASRLEGLYIANVNEAINVEDDVDDDVPVAHSYKITDEWVVRKFSKIDLKPWPKTKNTTISKIKI